MKLLVLYVVVGLAIASSIAFLILMECSAEQPEYAIASHDSNQVDSENAQLKPIVIWFHNAGHNTPETLPAVVSTGLVTHALILYGNVADRPISAQKNVIEAVEICKRNNVSVIWCRTLYSSYDEDFPRERLFDHKYYERIIEGIIKEAKVLGADFTAVDTEAYGYFPYKKELRDKPLSKKDFVKIKGAVQKAISNKGQLDFSIPAAKAESTHVYNAVIQLGRFKIAGHTYYNIPFLHKDKRRPYDVFGAYVNTVPTNEKYPNRPYFTPREILERQDLWAHKKGLMLYPKEDNIPNIVVSLTKITSIKPNKAD